MKAWFLAVAAAVTFAAGSAGAASWADPGFRMDVQQGRPGPDAGQRGRDSRADRRGEEERRGRASNDRPERLSDDERRALHRDLDKANRELYKPRPR